MNPSYISVLVQGTPSDLNFIKREDFKAYVDARGLKPGKYELDVKVNIPSGTVLIETFPVKVDATVNFCQNINPQDVVCFIDGFDSVILESKKEILSRFQQMNKRVIFSRASNKITIRTKYIQDKLFGNCNNNRLNTGMYIGYAQDIIDIWEGFSNNNDDQKFITTKCQREKHINKISIDLDNYIFYNYSPNDHLKVIKQKLYIDNNSNSCCIISSPGDQDINKILSEIGFKKIPKVQKQIVRRFTTYFKNFIPEFLLFIVVIIIFALFKVNIYLILFIVTIIFTFLEYQLKVKFFQIPTYKKVLYTAIDFAHLFISSLFYILVFQLLWKIIHFQCDLKILFLLNIIYLITLALFFKYKRCIISIINERISPESKGWKSVQSRVGYFFDQKPYFNRDKLSKGRENFTLKWMNGNIIIIIAITIVNIYYFILMKTKKCKVIY